MRSSGFYVGAFLLLRRWELMFPWQLIHIFCSNKEEEMVKVFMGGILESKAQTLVNIVNCVGVMGKGIALNFSLTVVGS